MPRKLLKAFGTHGRSVRVFTETFPDEADRQALVRVEWREQGKRKTESLPDTRDNQKRARAFAEGVAERLALHGVESTPRMTMRALGDAYLLAHPTPETWRPKTRKTFLGRWKVWIAFATPDRAIDTMRPELIDAFRKALADQDYAINQVANHVQMIKSVYTFARGRKYLTENAIADYRMRLSRDQRRLEVPEWTSDECGRIAAQFDPQSSRYWRAYVGVFLSALLGPRVNALLFLEWRDVDLEARTVRWRPELDKLAKDRVQPLPAQALEVLEVARQWREKIGYTGAYVIPGDARRRKQGTEDRPYSYQALNQALRSAAKRAGVRWIDYRALHGFRRWVANEVLKMTGNLTRAGQYIGDTDMRTLTKSYIRSRPEELRDVADAFRLPTFDASTEMPDAEADPKPGAGVQQNGNGQQKTASKRTPRQKVKL